MELGMLVALVVLQTPAAPPKLADRYTKIERRIPMRDGVELFAAIYLPKDAGSPHPILLKRTPYSCAPYGEANVPDSIAPSSLFTDRDYIVVLEDVRGCFQSGGDFEHMRWDVEARDAWDTIDWLVKNVPSSNGRVGLWGISYPGFYAAAGAIDAHPALKAVSPQAPIADWFFDDFHHHGAFFLAHSLNFFKGFGIPREGLRTEWPKESAFTMGTPDGYRFFLELGALSNVEPKLFRGRVPYWSAFVEHPNYDDYWKSIDLLPHLRRVAPAVLTVGGWFDAEDLYGPLQVYRATERLNPGAWNALVMGPWSHGGWARTDGDRLGNVRFGGRQSLWYREQVELAFFERHLRDQPAKELAEATMFETGANRWRSFEQWPPKGAQPRSLILRGDRMLALDSPPAEPRDAPASPKAARDLVACDEFTSDPRSPVPFTEAIDPGMTRAYMTDDQRFAARRGDVLSWQSAPLDADVTLAGPLLANLWVSTSQQDADWVVKLVDVFPGDFQWEGEDAEAAKQELTQRPAGAETPRPMGDYQMMVRSEVIRGRFRDGYAEPKPFTPGEPTLVKLPLQDVLHTFRKGHRIMIQVQSTWFPLVDRNPQKWVDNVFAATDADFVPAVHRVWRDPAHATRIDVLVLPAASPQGPAETPAAAPSGAPAR
jgi:putative CocE/NonD family hydrolase